MNALICVATALNIMSLPAGNTVVGVTQLGERVQIQDSSLLRDWVFIGTPGWDGERYLGVRSRGWVPYASLACH
jgi:hypothetical protein